MLTQSNYKRTPNEYRTFRTAVIRVVLTDAIETLVGADWQSAVVDDRKGCNSLHCASESSHRFDFTVRRFREELMPFVVHRLRFVYLIHVPLAFLAAWLLIP